MRIKHIYITKEGEPMANPEMEYPTEPIEDDDGELILNDSCPNCGATYDEIDTEYQICHLCKFDSSHEAMLAKYHSGLLPFEDREIVESLMTDSVDASHKEWKVKVICGRCCGHGVLDDEIGEPPTGYDCPICEGVGHFWSDCEHPAHYAGNSEDHDYRATFKPDTLIPVDLEVEVVTIHWWQTKQAPSGLFKLALSHKTVLRIKP